MPYFDINKCNKELKNILFIHIPKTGGTSIELYLSDKYHIKLDEEHILTTMKSNNFFEGISLQHQTLLNIINNNNIFKIDFNEIDIITVIRNPYHRLLSDLFFLNMIKPDSDQDEIHKIVKNILNENRTNKKKYDNHFTPQYLFISDEYNNLYPNIKILRTENLNNMMYELGYIDFNNFHNKSSNKIEDIDKYFNRLTKNIINKYYERDFILFNYRIL